MVLRTTNLLGAILACASTSLLLGQRPDEPHTPQKRPNIVVILVDDMGYSDLGCTGSEIATPNLDKLANDGMLFTNCYNTSRCCPSRAALLTGQYQWDAGMGHMTSTRSRYPEYQQALNRDNVTIPEVLSRHGYQTVMSGKWHVGSDRKDWPDRRGFQSFYGTPTGGGLYFYPSRFYDRPVYQDGVEVKPGSDWYSTDGFTDFAIEYLNNRDSSAPPFFMYLAYIAPHFPLQAKPQDIAKYETRYQAGYDSIRKARYEKQKSLGIVSTTSQLSESACPDWSNVDQEVEARKMAVYAAQIDCLDQNIGRFVATLKRTNAFDNTVIMFLSDNGGCANSFNKTPKVQIGSSESNATYGKWYNVSNTPYRMAKTQEHEGGIITPLIVSWPAGISRTASLNRQAVHIMDILPTCVELGQASLPKQFEGRNLDPIDGVSFAAALRGKRLPKERTMYWEHQGNKAVRRGDWKLVARHKKPWELYDLSVDPSETQDLAGKSKALVAELKKLYKTWANQHGVRSWPLRSKAAASK